MSKKSDQFLPILKEILLVTGRMKQALLHSDIPIFIESINYRGQLYKEAESLFHIESESPSEADQRRSIAGEIEELDRSLRPLFNEIKEAMEMDRQENRNEMNKASLPIKLMKKYMGETDPGSYIDKRK